jgi:hypothetical protein
MKLGFWSDVHNLTLERKTIGALDSDPGWRHEWQGLNTDGLSQDQAPILTAEKAAPEEPKEAKEQASDSSDEEATGWKNVGEEVNDTGDKQDKQDKDVEIE